MSINLLVGNPVLQHFHSFHLEHYRKSVVLLDCTVVEALFDTVGVVLADIDFVQPTQKKLDCVHNKHNNFNFVLLNTVYVFEYRYLLGNISGSVHLDIVLFRLAHIPLLEPFGSPSSAPACNFFLGSNK